MPGNKCFNKKLLQQKKDRIIYDCNRFRCTGKLYSIDHNLVQSYIGEIKVMIIHLNDGWMVDGWMDELYPSGCK